MPQMLKTGDILYEYNREQDKLNVKLILLFEGVVIAFFPFLLPLLPLTFYIWHRDLTDLSTDWKRKIDKLRVWTLFSLIPSFFAFYFFVFPYIPSNSIFIWSIYPQIAPHIPMLWSVVLFSVIVVATAYGMWKFQKWCKIECNPLKKYIKKDERYLFIPTRDHGVITIDKINTGIMVIGAPGGGKTELILQMMAQLPEEKDDAWIVFDPKGDYAKEFAKDGDIILALRGGTHAWNIFQEADLDPDDPDAMIHIEEDIKEITSGLLSDEAWTNDKFWIQSAREVLFGVIYTKIREAWEMYWNMRQGWINENKKRKENGEEPLPMPEQLKDIKNFLPTNYDLANFFKTTPLEKIYALLNKYEQTKSIAGFVNPDADKMALSVHATLISEVEKIFVGTFGSMNSAKLPQMSIKEYLKNPNGRKLFILYDVQKGEVIGNIYKVLIERAIKFALGGEYGAVKLDGNKNILDQIKKEREEAKKKGKKVMKGNEIKRRKYFIIDEFQNIPPVRNYQQLVNFGRSLGCTSIIGIQSLAQIDKKYKQEGTNSIVAGHGVVFSFRAFDKRTSQFVMERLGEHVMHFQRPVSAPTPRGSQATIGREIQRVNFYPVSEAEMRYYKAGEVLLITTHGWKKLRLLTYEEAVDKLHEFQRTLWKLRMDEKLRQRIKEKKKEMKVEMQKVAMEKKKEIEHLKNKKQSLFKPPKKTKPQKPTAKPKHKATPKKKLPPKKKKKGDNKDENDKKNKKKNEAPANKDVKTQQPPPPTSPPSSS